MIDEQTFEQAVKEEAFAIWQARMRLGLSGTQEGDWADAERKLWTAQVDDILSTKICYSRIKDLM